MAAKLEATSHLERVYGDRASVRVVKHTTLGTSVPHFAAMADRLVPQSAPSTGHGGKAGVLPRIWHVFMQGSPSARAVKHATLDTSAPHFAAMADRLLPQSVPSTGNGGGVSMRPRIWHAFMGGGAIRAPGKTHHFGQFGPALCRHGR